MRSAAGCAGPGLLIARACKLPARRQSAWCAAAGKYRPYLAAAHHAEPGPGPACGCSEHRSLGGTADLCPGFRFGLETSLAGRISGHSDAQYGSFCAFSRFFTLTFTPRYLLTEQRFNCSVFAYMFEVFLSP